MVNATGEAEEPPLRVAFDRRLKLGCHGATTTRDGGLLADADLDAALAMRATTAALLADDRRGKRAHHRLRAEG